MRREQLFGILGAMVVLGLACKAKTQTSLRGGIADQSHEFEILGNFEELGDEHIVRIALKSDHSKCLIPGEPVRYQTCGSTANFRVLKNFQVQDVASHSKMLQSIHTRECLEAIPGRSTSEFRRFRSTFRRRGSSIPQKDSRLLLITSPCFESRSTQHITTVDGTLSHVDGNNKPKVPVNAENFVYYVAQRSDKGTSASDAKFLDFLVDTEIITKQGGRFTERSTVNWGNVPAITEIRVALDQEKGLINGIQLTHVNGKKEYFGQCLRNNKGDCIVSDETQHVVKRGNQFDYINDVEVAIDASEERYRKFRKGERGTAKVLPISGVRFLNQKNKVILEAIVKDTNGEWQSVKKKGGQFIQRLGVPVLAGLISQADHADVTSVKINSRLTDDPRKRKDQLAYITGLGGIYVKDMVYTGLNKEIYDSGSNVMPNILEDHKAMIGWNGAVANDSDPHLNELISLMDTRFTSNLFADRYLGPMSEGIATIRFCGDRVLDGFMIEPKNVEKASTAAYGRNNNCKNPQFFVFDPGEQITEVYWIPEYGGGYSQPRIGGISFNTNRQNGRAWWNGSSGNQWQKAFGKEGYVIVGFHGIGLSSYDDHYFIGDFSPGSYPGILGLGAIYAKKSDITQKIKKYPYGPLKKLPMVGEDKGTYFEDGIYLTDLKKGLKSIDFYFDKEIKGFSVHYHSGQTFTYGEKKGEPKTVSLDKGEILTGVDYYHKGKKPLGLRLKNNEGKVLLTIGKIDEAKEDEIVSQKVPSGKKILGFYGRQGDPIDTFGDKFKAPIYSLGVFYEGDK